MPVPKEVSEYMAALGRKSRRKLSSEDARAMAIKAAASRRKKKEANE